MEQILTTTRVRPEVTTEQRITGAVFGSAYGDALASRTEFLSIASIVRAFGPHGPEDLHGTPALVTDDTQMMLAVGEAIAACSGVFTPAAFEAALRVTFEAWFTADDNTRAPGATCMSACGALGRHAGTPWQAATVLQSKGCGTVMRVLPVGLLQGVTERTRAGMAQLQAAMTHGHPTAICAADMTAHGIAYLVAGGDLITLPHAMAGYAYEQAEVYHADWLGDLWQVAGATSPQAFIGRGWRECSRAMRSLLSAQEMFVWADDPWGYDPCLETGAAWVADEAIATAALCALTFPDDAVAALQRAAVTSGDSDTIACLTGAIMGAVHGADAFPAAWRTRIEYAPRLEALTRVALGAR